MAISTAITQLFNSATAEGTFTKVCDIIDYPDMGTSPSKLDTTTLSTAKIKTFIFGLQDSSDLTFMANYTKTDYSALKLLEDTTQFWELRLGEAGEDGIFSWSGEIITIASGQGVDEVRKMTLNLSAETEIAFA